MLISEKKNYVFVNFTITIRTKWVKDKSTTFHTHPQHSQINSIKGGPWISYVSCLLVTHSKSTALQIEA